MLTGFALHGQGKPFKMRILGMMPVEEASDPSKTPDPGCSTVRNHKIYPGK